MTRTPHAQLATAAVVLMIAAPPEVLSAPRPAEAESPAPPRSVFDAPPEEELASLSHPALRVELLRMAADDQHARLSGS